MSNKEFPITVIASDTEPVVRYIRALNAEIVRLQAECDQLCADTAQLSTTAFDNRDLLDVIANDDDVPIYRRNEARQAVVDFDRALSGADAP